ncbi:hypothetical protein [Amycolatopsis palatopharyngis]|uniref:hypothetical protein n=1 Tax=Amycolatopsis palatopharyngis TaxID=187982 RepID=UPI000E23BE5E|nr:hypothetical protein [Amycolatopsis palatopharyngis]
MVDADNHGPRRLPDASNGDFRDSPELGEFARAHGLDPADIYGATYEGVPAGHVAFEVLARDEHGRLKLDGDEVGTVWAQVRQVLPWPRVTRRPTSGDHDS